MRPAPPHEHRGGAHGGRRLKPGQPRGLSILFLTQMWETFSFFGMRALLVYYMTKQLLLARAGLAGVLACTRRWCISPRSPAAWFPIAGWGGAAP